MDLLLSLDPERAGRAEQLRAQQPLRVELNLHGVGARLDTNSAYLADHLRVGYGYFESPGATEPEILLLAVEADPPPDQARQLETLLPGRKDAMHFLIPSRDGPIFLFRQRSLLAFYTVTALFGQAVRRLHPRFACLHAATVAQGGRGLMLCGAARCGKTVLTALLLQRGVEYCSDDVTLLARDSLTVAPFPRAINVREEYERLVSPLLARARSLRRLEVAEERRLMADLALSVPDSVEPRVLCFPRYGEGQRARLEPLSPATALVTLMHHRFHPWGSPDGLDPGADLDTLSELAERTRACSLVFSDVEEAATLLESLLSEPPEHL